MRDSWRLVLGGFGVLALSNAVGFYGLAVYLGALQASGDFAHEFVSALTSVFFIVGGVASLITGRILPVIGVRPTLVLGSVLTAVGMVLVGHVQSPIPLLLAYVMLGAGMPMAGPITLTTALMNRHIPLSQRNQAIAIMLTGMTAGGAVIVPFLAGSVEDLGLARTTSIVAPLIFAGLLLSTLVVGPTPEATTLRPRGSGTLGAGNHSDEPRGGLGVFVLLSATFAMFLGAQVGFNTQLYAISLDYGIAGAGSALGLMAGVGLFARLLGIVLIRWLRAETFLAAMAVFQALSAVVLVLWPTTIGIHAAAALLGLAVGNASVLSPVITARLFGRRRYAKVFSRLTFIITLGTAAGPLAIGALRPIASSYSPILVGVALLSVLVACLCLLLGKIR